MWGQRHRELLSIDQHWVLDMNRGTFQILHFNIELEKNCDFSVTIMFGLRFVRLFGDHFKYCWVIFIMRD